MMIELQLYRIAKYLEIGKIESAIRQMNDLMLNLGEFHKLMKILKIPMNTQQQLVDSFLHSRYNGISELVSIYR